jgi:hypothetical protein
MLFPREVSRHWRRENCKEDQRATGKHFANEKSPTENVTGHGASGNTYFDMSRTGVLAQSFIVTPIVVDYGCRRSQTLATSAEWCVCDGGVALHQNVFGNNLFTATI